MTGLWLIVLLRCSLLLLSVRHPLVPAKLHLFSFVAGIFEPYWTRFATDAPMVLFMFDELSAISKKLVSLIFKKDAIDNAQSIASMLNKKWLQDS